MPPKKPDSGRKVLRQRVLADAEWEIMRVVWRDEPCAAGDVQEALREKKAWAYSTVKMTMNRMVRHGLLKVTRIRNLQLFSALITEQEAKRREILKTVKKAFEGAMTPTIQFLLENEEFTDEEIKQLRKLLDKRGRKQS